MRALKENYREGGDRRDSAAYYSERNTKRGTKHTRVNVPHRDIKDRTGTETL